MFNCKVHNWSHIERLCPVCTNSDISTTDGTGSGYCTPNSTYPMMPNNEVEIASIGLPKEQLLALMTAILRPHFMLNEQALDKAREILDLVEE